MNDLVKRMLPSPKLAQAAVLALLCSGVIACHHQTVQAAPPVSAPEPEPAKAEPTPPPPTDTGTSIEPAKPNENEAPPGGSPLIPTPIPVAPKPKPVPAPTPTPEPAAPKPAAPTISQRMTPAQEAELKNQTQKSIAEAQANLQRTTGRQLNDVQRDMVEKIQNFLVQAREASELPDWNRARILADKARVLSSELVNSL